MLAGRSPMEIALVSLLWGAPTAQAVCPHCKDSIPGCGGGDACPLVTDLAANAAIFAESKLGQAPRLTHLMMPELAAHFPRPVAEAVVGIACAPAVGTGAGRPSEVLSAELSGTRRPKR